MIIQSEISAYTSFNGSDEYITANGVATALSGTTTGTWACWVKLDDATPSTNDGVFTSNDQSGPTTIQFFIAANTGRLVGSFYNAGAYDWILQTDAQALVDDTWGHVALVHDGVSPVLYVNGIAVAQTFTNTTDVTAWYNDSATIDNFLIGGRLWNGQGSASILMGGDMAQGFVCNSDLSAAQVLEAFSLGRKNVSYSGTSFAGDIVSHWSLDALNPIDNVGSNNGTSILMDSSNIIEEGDIAGNQGLIISSQGADVTDNQGMIITSQ
jgi:hypothetical protein